MALGREATIKNTRSSHHLAPLLDKDSQSGSRWTTSQLKTTLLKSLDFCLLIFNLETRFHNDTRVHSSNFRAQMTASLILSTNRFAQEASKGTIIAGSGDLRRIFYVHKSALEKSSIIKGWIEEPGTIPSSLHKDSALCFPAVDPEVMETVVRYLERDEREQWAFDLRGKALEEVKAPVDHIFYVRLYKLALSLA